MQTYIRGYFAMHVDTVMRKRRPGLMQRCVRYVANVSNALIETTAEYRETLNERSDKGRDSTASGRVVSCC